MGGDLQFSLARRTALTTLTGRRRLPVQKRRRTCCVEFGTGTNITTFHHSQDSLVSVFFQQFSKHPLLLFTITLAGPPHSIASGPEASGNWEVVDAHSPKSESRFYLNVCHKVVHSGAAAGCPMKASICAVGKSHMEEELFLMVVEIY